jgi:hypothetical protein
MFHPVKPYGPHKLALAEGISSKRKLPDKPEAFFCWVPSMDGPRVYGHYWDTHIFALELCEIQFEAI